MISPFTAFPLKPKARVNINQFNIPKWQSFSNMRTVINTHWCMYVCMYICMYCLTIHDMFLCILKFMAKGKHSTSSTFSTQWFLHVWWCQPPIYQVSHLNAYDGLSHLGYEPSIGVFYWSNYSSPPNTLSSTWGLGSWQWFISNDSLKLIIEFTLLKWWSEQCVLRNVHSRYSSI
jgi:hypothetical protein